MMSEGNIDTNNLLSSHPLKNDDDYKKIKKELDPLLTEILFITGKVDPKYQQFKRNMVDWQNQFIKAITIGGKVSSIQQFRLKTDNPQLISTIKLFEYLGLIESIGSTYVDLLLLLLISCGKDFHVERYHEAPRIIHATCLDDLKGSEVSLYSKLRFLERNGLKKTIKPIDRELRNDIAHLNFNVDKSGKISTIHKKHVDINKKLNDFNKWSTILTIILAEIKFYETTDRL